MEQSQQQFKVFYIIFSLTFAQFSAIIITKQDKLLAKIVLQRQQMGAIPNFLLDKVKLILFKQIQIHQFCMKCQIDEDDLKDWIQTVVDQNGDTNQTAIDEFMADSDRSYSNQSLSLKERPFIRFLRSSGNITAERLFYLWKGCNNHQSYLHDLSSKLQKLSTNISSPKSLLGSQSYHNLRPQFYDCLSRPINEQKTEIRYRRSIEKHINRVNSQKSIKLIIKHQKITTQQQKEVIILLKMLNEIIEVQKQTQNLRIELRLCPDFYPILFYQSIPKDRNKSITPTNFKDYLQSFGQYAPIHEIYYLFRRYALNSKLNFNSFCSMFDTTQKQFNLLQKNRFVQSLQDINYQTKKAFFALLLLIIKNEIKINQLKIKYMKKMKNIVQIVNHIFQSFSNIEDQLNEEQIRSLFRYYLKITIKSIDIRIILRRCDCLKENEQILTKMKFMKEIIPYITKMILYK